MKNLLSKLNMEKIITILIIVAMILLPVVEFICSLNAKHFYYQEEIVVLLGEVSFLFLLFLALNKGKISIYKSDILLIVLFGFALLSLIFSKDIEQSLNGGKLFYREGILVFFSYYCVALLSSRILQTNYRKLILKAFLGLALIETFVGIFQFFGIWPYPALLGNTVEVGENAFGIPTWAFAFTENCNYFAALAVIFTGLTGGAFLLSEGKKRILYFILTAFCFYGVVVTYSRLGLLGVLGFICYLFLISFIAHKQKIKKIALAPRKIFMLLSLYIAVYLLAILISPELLGSTKKFATEFTVNNALATGVTETGANAESAGGARLFIWKEGLETVPKYWYIGTGLDNYVYSFFWDNPDYTGYYQDKGHNEYIHILVTQGVFTLVTWLTLIFYNLTTATKRFFYTDNEETKLTFILIVMYGGYLCQALANSSVTNVAIYNWIITGLLLYAADKKPLKTFTFEQSNS